jgi:hypothetical protein
MPRNSRKQSQSINDVINQSVEAVVARILPALQHSFQAAVDARIRAELAGRKMPRGRRGGSSRRAGEMTRWVADNRARRVPTFVIEATSLDTKKKIVAKYGPNTVFEKGKPLPPVKLVTRKTRDQEAKPREVKAKPPLIRKAAAATR